MMGWWTWRILYTFSGDRSHGDARNVSGDQGDNGKLTLYTRRVIASVRVARRFWVAKLHRIWRNLDWVGRIAMPTNWRCRILIRARGVHNRTRNMIKGPFLQFLASPCILEGWTIKHIMFRMKFWILVEKFTEIWQGQHTLEAICGLFMHFIRLIKEKGSSLWSPAALDAFPKITVSLKPELGRKRFPKRCDVLGGINMTS